MSPLSRQRGLLKIHKTKVVSLHWSAVFSPDAVQLYGNRFTVSTRSGGFIGLSLFRLQNSPYFCVFKHARAVKQNVSNKAENRERDWGETLKIFSLASHARVRLARFARARLLRHALPISLLVLRKKPTVLQSSHYFFRLAVRARLVLLAWLIHDLNFICSIMIAWHQIYNRGGERSFCVILPMQILCSSISFTGNIRYYEGGGG